MFEMTNENVARLLRGLTIAVGNRKNRILIYQFLAAEIRALHYSYGVGDGESYKRALTFLEECERLTLRSLVRKSAERHAEVTVDHAKRVFVRALKKLNAYGYSRVCHLLWNKRLLTTSPGITECHNHARRPPELPRAALSIRRLAILRGVRRVGTGDRNLQS